MKSLRSIQNQYLKQIEIIIVDDISPDVINKLYEKILKEEPRIRLFRHLKNRRVLLSRLDGFLYSKGEYIHHFYSNDIYADYYVLEDT